jgi:PLP dependent protein
VIKARILEIRQRVADACRRTGRNPNEVHIMAVGKTHPAGVVAQAAGLVDAFGENRVQEAAAKRPCVAGVAPWHLIGPLQRNKARAALETFDCIQSVDRPEIADRLEVLLGQDRRELPCFVEVNIGGEPQKGGVLPSALPGLLRHLLEHCPHLRVRGLMAIPPWDEDPERSRVFFAALRRLRDAHLNLTGSTAIELSMGMSSDYEVAVEEGATWIRLGRVLFGERGDAVAGVSDPS